MSESVEAGSGRSESTYSEESEYLKGTETCHPEPILLSTESVSYQEMGLTWVLIGHGFRPEAGTAWAREDGEISSLQLPPSGSPAERQRLSREVISPLLFHQVQVGVCNRICQLLI